MVLDQNVGTFLGQDGADHVDINDGLARGGPGPDTVWWNTRSGTFHRGAGGDRVTDANFGTFHGGADGDRVNLNKRPGTFYGGRGFDTVKTNKGRFFPGPQ
jgi:hypothetical protein